ncbi:hypothetical protein [Criblamydia sequanensis]|uniref:Conserved putative secreted protein n=1 Tax=Candidatus Criblamydia sequanensis CRIB-18 TaxID=1437425 RepID=A0A090D386_9BACT|nr:hypothetical protein [Criblamydia sequanensis]CDR35271.1 Conserved putative secreted protein [Criblamydia sequanensis CRIB-18]
MGNFHISRIIRSSILCTTTVAFFSGSIFAPSLAVAYEYQCQSKEVNINLNDVAFIVRLEKLYEKAKRYLDKLEQGKLIDVMCDINIEIESYTEKKIDLDSLIDVIESEAKKQGAHFKKGEISQIKRDLKKSWKKRNHRALYLYQCNLYDIEFDQAACDLDYEMMAKSAEHHGMEDENEVKVPIRVSIGITASLCGYFLSFIPHPYAQAASKFLIATGVGLCVDGTITRMEENEKNH